MLNIGWTELLLVLGVALLIFGPGKLPELGQTLGKTIREFKGAINNIDADIKKEVNDIKSDVQEVKDAVDIKATIQDIQTDIQDAVKVDLNDSVKKQ
ncbi:MAG: twin-arginine translocase TatA/TatE family subunit [Peptococcaceae bacterium]